MSARGTTLPTGRSDLPKAWLVVLAIVIVSAMVISIALTTVRSRPVAGSRPLPVHQAGPVRSFSSPERSDRGHLETVSAGTDSRDGGP